jgi:hypothetical protein
MGKQHILGTLKLKLNSDDDRSLQLWKNYMANVPMVVGDDDGKRVWIELDMLRYVAVTNLQH